jgi:HSP20 family protein
MTLLANDNFFELDNFFSGLRAPYRRAYARRPFKATAQETQTEISPKIDIIKKDDAYQLVAELPGITKDQLNVTVEESILTIEATQAEKNENTQYLRQERHPGKFRRSFDLGQDTELSDITANFRDGLLILDIPKQKEEVPTTRRIDIH